MINKNKKAPYFKGFVKWKWQKENLWFGIFAVHGVVELSGEVPLFEITFGDIGRNGEFLGGDDGGLLVEVDIIPKFYIVVR